MVIEFILNHWIDISVIVIAFFIITARILPPELAGLEKTYRDNSGNLTSQRKQSLLEAVMTAMVFTLNRSLIVVIGFKGVTSLLIFAVVGVELVYRQTISTNAVVLAVVGIIALHFERLIDDAEEINFWKIFSWKRRK